MNRPIVLTAQFLVAALVASTAPAESTAVLQPGNPAVSCRGLAPYEHAWSWRTVMPDGSIRPQGIWSDHLDATITADGRPIWRRVQGMTYLNGASRTDVLTFDRNTCAPITSEQHRLNGVVLKHRFTDGQVAAERTEPPAATRSTKAAMQTTPFDFLNGEDGPLLAVLPLRVGYRAQLLSAEDLPVGDGTTRIGLKVLREQTVSGGGMGRIRTFVVESPLPGGEGVQTFYISRKPPYFIRLEVALADHRRWIFDQI